MCAISGVLDLKFDKQVLEKMLSTMLHRGPDATGSFLSRQCVLLHSRLSIIDPQGGAQPMRLNWQGKEFVIVYNGEIYNTQELRCELQLSGHEFIGTSDTEVVLHGYAQWEEGLLDKLNGIFAFAVWEVKSKKLFLARDRIGVKPLFYKLHEGGFLFASEIKTILNYPTVEAELDFQGAASLLLIGPGRIPGCAVFKDIMELKPGCCGIYREGKWEERKYWTLRDREHRASFSETAEHVRYLVTDAIKRQMVSDVPVGTFLSGGLDSSIITAVCAGKMQESGKILNTFSVDYKDNERYFKPGKFQPNADPEYIKIIQSHLGTEHHWTVLSPEELMDAMDVAMEARDLPGMADVDASLLLFCKQIRPHVKVALSGECADEIFGGYPWYRDPQIRAKAGFPWAQNTTQRADFLNEDIVEAINPNQFVMDHYNQTIALADVLPGTSDTERRMKEMMQLNFLWFMQTLLDRKDRMSMHSGLEVRVPFCDYRIADYLYAVPWEFKNRDETEKGLLRHAMKGLLPDTVLWRKKSPYPKTHDPKYARLVETAFRSMLRDHQAPIFQIVRLDALSKLLYQDHPWPWYGQLMKTPQTMAYMLQLNSWLKVYNVRVIC